MGVWSVSSSGPSYERGEVLATSFSLLLLLLKLGRFSRLFSTDPGLGL
jgi:hypothetical protein